MRRLVVLHCVTKAALKVARVPIKVALSWFSLNVIEEKALAEFAVCISSRLISPRPSPELMA
jgi:hypothetical protein